MCDQLLLHTTGVLLVQVHLRQDPYTLHHLQTGKEMFSSVGLWVVILV